MRILAIDYGLKRIGIAVTDPLQIICQPLTTVDTNQIFIFLSNYLISNQVEKIIIGYPKKLDNTDALITQNIDKFMVELQKTYPEVLLIKWDERFTSKLAVERMIEGGYKKKDRQNKKNIDKIAAAIILEDYINYMNNNK